MFISNLSPPAPNQGWGTLTHVVYRRPSAQLSCLDLKIRKVLSGYERYQNLIILDRRQGAAHSHCWNCKMINIQKTTTVIVIACTLIVFIIIIIVIIVIIVVVVVVAAVVIIINIIVYHYYYYLVFVQLFLN